MAKTQDPLPDQFGRPFSHHRPNTMLGLGRSNARFVVFTLLAPWLTLTSI